MKNAYNKLFWNLINNGIGAKIITPEKEFYNKVEAYYIDCITSFFKKDKQTADELIAKRPELLDQADKLMVQPIN